MRKARKAARKDKGQDKGSSKLLVDLSPQERFRLMRVIKEYEFWEEIMGAEIAWRFMEIEFL